MAVILRGWGGRAVLFSLLGAWRYNLEGGVDVQVPGGRRGPHSFVPMSSSSSEQC